jgi:hypothetical protein
MSVANSSEPPSWAEIITPERAWTALRVEATRVAVCNCVSSSADDREIFMRTAGKGSEE